MKNKGDIIRSMSNEEMAKFLSDLKLCSLYCPVQCKLCGMGNNCFNAWFNFLNTEQHDETTID